MANEVVQTAQASYMVEQQEIVDEVTFMAINSKEMGSKYGYNEDLQQSSEKIKLNRFYNLLKCLCQ